MSDPMDFEESAEPAPIKPPPPIPPPSPSFQSARSRPIKPSPVPGILTGLLLGAILAGLGYGLAMVAGKKEETPPAAAPAPTPATAATEPGKTETKPTEPAHDHAALAGRVDGLTSEIQGLAKRVDDLQKGLADAPKPAPAPDLRPIEARIDALAKRLEGGPSADPKAIEEQVAKAAAGQNEAVAKLGTQVGGLEKTISDQKEEIATLKDQIKSLAAAKPAQPTQPAAGAAPAAAVAPDADFARAVDLFKKGQYAPARDAFARLQESSPNDARVFYYGALSNGSATNVWTGETERLVNKGVELEKAGTPDAARINAAFADLAPPAMKNWLDFYRARAR